ncbi:hypothetical protein [Paenibacillus sp. VMFN-D1]|uniref:hypothetical protein n=1 Tax=Paenibacillus sp. VMFN-D1 TaxID=2135608 RepID=UPI000E2739CA|nr:hypothetical protein [Paenibacillus sp. VMFN-D1]RED41511.1 hypothetical protein C7820_2688 [Paenibacillus sp. VMFN-D1]
MDKEYKDRQEPVNRDEKEKHARMDHPEQYATERESLFDRFESERNVDPIPVEDLTENMKDEQNKEHTKDSSSSEKKYRP